MIPAMLFDRRFLRTLEVLEIVARRVVSGDERAERRAPRKGASVEFADYRRYAAGDEVRYIDWNVYARHGSLFVKEFSAEENVHVSILLDASGSMNFGGKFAASRELAAALGYIGLVHYDSVSLYAFDREVRTVRRFLRGRARVFEMLESLEGLSAGGVTDMRAAFRAALPRLKGRSLALVLTDFYDLAGYAEAVRSLLAQRIEVRLIHVASRDELAPGFRGRFRLVDLETGREREVTVAPGLVEEYRRRFAGFCAEIEEFARAHEAAYARVMADDPLERRAMEVVRAGGILERR